MKEKGRREGSRDEREIGGKGEEKREGMTGKGGSTEGK